jgi:hypothetical protein
MDGANCVLIVFDEFRVRDDSLRKAIELAKRLDCCLSALVLPGGDAHDDPRAEACLDAIREACRAAGVYVQPELVDGDPSSALLKYLATHPPFRAVVWGGDELVVSTHPYGGGRHWFGSVRRQIRCPLVTAASSRGSR